MNADASKTVLIQELAPAIEQVISGGGSIEMTVPGKSMEPTLHDRISRVRVVKIAAPKRGDMVLYRRDNGKYVLHRIIECAEDGTFVLCGDAQYRKEPGIRREQMIAVVTAFTRGKNWISCEDPLYRCWWRICVSLRWWRHGWAAVRRRIRNLRP